MSNEAKALVSVNEPCTFEEDPHLYVETYHRAIDTLRRALEAKLVEAKRKNSIHQKLVGRLEIPNRASVTVDILPLYDNYFNEQLTRVNPNKYPPLTYGQSHQFVSSALRSKPVFIAHPPPSRLKQRIQMTHETRRVMIAMAIFTLVTLLIIALVI